MHPFFMSNIAKMIKGKSDRNLINQANRLDVKSTSILLMPQIFESEVGYLCVKYATTS